MAWHRCEKCGKKFAFQKSLIEHQIQAKHNPTSRGQPLTSGQIQQAVRHPEVLRCKQCSYEAVGSTVDLELHIRLQHASGAQPSTNGARSTKSNNNSGYKCNKCRKMFDSLPTLIRHKEIFHPPEAQYALQLKPTGNTNFPKSKSGLKCRLCGKAFPTPFSFEQHLIKKHRSPSAASATSVISCSRSTSGGSRSGGSGTATSPDSCTGAAPPPPMLNRTAAVPLRTTKERRRLLENHRCRTQIVSQNYGPALTNKATEFPVIYRCIVQGYLQWLKDSDYEPVCTLCRRELIQEECVRLLCYHVFHWRCLDEQLSQLPLTTAPAGYACPMCGHEVIPRDNVVSPVADIVRVKLERARWANPGGGAKRPSGRQHDSHLQHTHNPRDSGFTWTSSSPTPNGASQSSFMDTVNSNPHSAINAISNNTTSSRGPALLKQGAAFFESSIPSVPGRSFVSPQHSLSRGEDEDKYKKKSVLELIHRWFQSKLLLGGRRRGDPMKRWAAIIIAIAIGMLLMIYFMSRVGQLSAELDPMLSPNFNPALRSRDN